MSEKPKLVLVDGHALIYRAFHAVPRTLSTSKGEITNAIFGFTAMLLNVLKREAPECVVVALDVGRTFRHEEFEAYKAHRPPMPEELSQQIHRVREVVEALDIPIYEAPGYEADDVIGALAEKAQEAGMEVIIVTGDSDALQLVKSDVKVVTPSHQSFSEPRVYDEAAVEERYGFAPRFVPDFKALVGDSSDNIPGVPGIGKKTATDLIRRFGSLDDIYAHLDEVTPVRARDLLAENREQALQSKYLASIVTDVPVTFDLASCRRAAYDRKRIVELFRELEFRSLLSKLPDDVNRSAPPEKSAVVQPSLFLGEQPEPAEKMTGADRDYQTVTEPGQLAALVANLERSTGFVVDVETTGKDPTRADLVGISVSAKPGEAFYVPVGHAPSLLSLGAEEQFLQIPLAAAIEALRPVMENESIPKYAHNAKYDMMILRRNGIELKGLSFDTCIAAYLIGDNSVGLKDLAFTRLGLEMKPITDLIGTGRNQMTMAEVPIAEAAPYACADADMTYRLMLLFEPELKEMGLWSLFTEIEMPLVPVLAAMEERGVALDTATLMEMSRGLYQKVADLEKEVYLLAKHEFNINSPKQLATVLFEELGLPGRQRTQTGYSTNFKVLENLKGVHPITDAILEYRQLMKLKSTYVDALPLLVNPRTGRVHTSFNQTVTTTGRLSSSEPNLQNIPIRTEMGRGVRRAFVAGRSNPVARADDPLCLMAADYSQVELRILAHITLDERLLAAFDANLDVHSSTAAEVFDVDLGQVTPEMRRVAKVVNFGIIYGMSSFGLSQGTGLSPKEADSFIQRYMANYPGVKQYIEKTLEEARRSGYVMT
ncbi:MAG: DNA polymerase I, partial [Chloroflexi bacterium]|nr:DNA polymerase I [Chloroflexota bacterium]